MKNKKNISKNISKIILSGEHAVLYGASALTLPISKPNSTIFINNGEKKDDSFKKSEIFKNYENTFKQKLDIDVSDLNVLIKSSIPIGSGLGSSASISLGLTKATLKFYDLKLKYEDFIDIPISIENLNHGKSSNIDLLTINSKKPIFFNENKELKNLKNINQNSKLLIVNSNEPGLTSEAVEIVKKNISKLDIEIINKISYKIKYYIENEINPFEIGKLLTLNHQILKKNGISTKNIEKIISISNEFPIYGSKLTGSGLGGSVIILTDEKIVDKLINKLNKNNFNKIWIENL